MLTSLTHDIRIIATADQSISPGVFKVFYTPINPGPHELKVKANGSILLPLESFISNKAHLSQCKMIKSCSKMLKHTTTEFELSLNDEDGSPCVSKQNVSAELQCIKSQKAIIVEPIYKDSNVEKCAFSFSCNEAGEHSLVVSVNGEQCSSFSIMAVNNPDPMNCTAEVPLQVMKHEAYKLPVVLRDSDGEPCVTEQQVKATLHSVNNAKHTELAVAKTAAMATYEVTFKPQCSREHTLDVEVNGLPIQGAPFKILVVNVPDPHTCTASIVDQPLLVEKGTVSTFTIDIRDSDGEPCVTKQYVTATTLKHMHMYSVTTDIVVTRRKTIGSYAYAVEFKRFHTGEEFLNVKVNGEHIHGSPFKVLVRNVQNKVLCEVSGFTLCSSAQRNKRSQIQVRLTDSSTTSNHITAELISLRTSTVVKTVVTSGALSTSSTLFNISYKPQCTGAHVLRIKVNGKDIHGSPFAIIVHDQPDPLQCTLVSDGGHDEATLSLMCSDGTPCIWECTSTLEATLGGVTQRVPCRISGQDELSRFNRVAFDIYVSDSPCEHFVVETSIQREDDFTYSCERCPKSTSDNSGWFKLVMEKPVFGFANCNGFRLSKICADTAKSVQITATVLPTRLSEDITTDIKVVQKDHSTYTLSYEAESAMPERAIAVTINKQHIQGSPFKVKIPPVDFNALLERLSGSEDPYLCKIDDLQDLIKQEMARLCLSSPVSENSGEVCLLDIKLLRTTRSRFHSLPFHYYSKPVAYVIQAIWPLTELRRFKVTLNSKWIEEETTYILHLL